MKKLLFLLGLLYTTTALADDKFLPYQFNENVVIVISNVKCPIKTMFKEYPFAVLAQRIDGDRLYGCFTHKGDDVVIQWAGGDQTILPANYFLQQQ